MSEDAGSEPKKTRVVPWKFRARDYAEERRRYGIELLEIPANEDPLISEPVIDGNAASAIKTSKNLTVSSDPLDDDPLASFDHDPLASASSVSTSDISSHSQRDDSFEPWEAKTPRILMKYTTSERLSLASSFLGGRVVGETVKDKVNSRLEEMEDQKDEVKQMDNLTQQEFMDQIDSLEKKLTGAWQAGRKVDAIKIVIQSSKMLGSVKVLKFYPSKFVLISRILDKFGSLVFDRLFTMARDVLKRGRAMTTLPSNFTAEMIPNEAMEICRNWFYKIASIRELLPRILVECAMLKSYRFLPNINLDDVLTRLMKQARGVGDPLISMYVRAYICKLGKLVIPTARQYLTIAFDDVMLTLTQVDTSSVRRVFLAQKLSASDYMNLYVPALDWIMQCVSHKASPAALQKIIDACMSSQSGSVLLNAVMASFPPAYVAARASQFIELTKSASKNGLEKYRLYQTLGYNVNMVAPPEKEKKAILNSVWSIVTKMTDPGEYIACAEAWIDYPVRYLTYKHLNVMLKDIISHMSNERAFEQHYDQLQVVANKILAVTTDFGDLFGMESFLPFVYLFQDPVARYEVCKSILISFSERQDTPISDPVVIGELLNIGKIVHDRIDSMTSLDERKHISSLVVSYLSKTSFGSNSFDLELEFFVKARGCFTNLDSVLVYMVRRVNQLIMRIHKRIKGVHNKKTSPFVRSCISFCFITIPTVTDYLMRMKLYIVSGAVSVANKALSQADVFFNAAIDLIQDLPDRVEIELTMEPIEPLLQPIIQQLLSTLLILPDHPENERLLIAKRLFGMLRERTWVSALVEVQLNLACFQILAAFAQRRYLYGVKDVEANDQLYESNPKFIAELGTLASQLVLNMQKKAQGIVDPSLRAGFFLDALESFVRLSDLSDGVLAGIAVDFATLARQASPTAQVTVDKIVERLEQEGDALPNVSATCSALKK